MSFLSFMFFSANLLFLFSEFSNATDTITSSKSVSDGSTLVSRNGSFELGFFSPGSSSNRYVGIWYKKIPVRTVVWVANRRNPINDSSGLLLIDGTGNLVLVGKNKSVVWSTNSEKQARNPSVQLLDSGNLVLRDGNDDGNDYLWQSFDYPSDTMLPGMKLGHNYRTGLDSNITAWKNWDDPSPGDFVWKVQLHNYPELAMWKDSKIYSRSSPWNGITFTGSPQLKPNPLFSYNFVYNEEEAYYVFYPKKKSKISRNVMNQTTVHRERYIWNEVSRSWGLYTYTPIDLCDRYDQCGANGICGINRSPVCQCLKGFKPKSPEQWISADWSQGCVRNASLDCKNGDGFMKLNGLKLPDTRYSWVDKSMNLKECRAKCLQNCSCTAYTNLDIRGEGSGCAIWFNDLIDIRQYSPPDGQDLYVRMSASELDVKAKPNKKMVTVIVAIAIFAVSVMVLVSYFCKMRTKVKDKKEDKTENEDNNDGTEEEKMLSMFDLTTIGNATENFSVRNKLGEGGFGPVYKGTLADGQEIAVKRLSRNSGQGPKEFKNEVLLIVKLQHRNLVKLLGCCIQGDERMLIYEYLPNKSLDFFIFDETRGKSLDWCKRLNIIRGIARGLLYLHQDSRLRIIHRDLKTSNVLLDNDMNPKISDFGMAKTFGGDQTEGNTNRVVGTYGYMAPEYATDGLFSVKSDVFSFGIIMLEIISGKKSRGFCHINRSVNLIGYAWRLWGEDKCMDLVDPVILLGDSWHEETGESMRRCIHISLLCVQQYPEHRPTMASVVVMLDSDTALPRPKQPGFFLDHHNGPSPSDSSLTKPDDPSSSSTGEITVTMPGPL